MDITLDNDPEEKSLNERLDKPSSLSKNEQQISKEYSDGITPSFVELHEDNEKDKEKEVDKLVFRQSRFFLNLELGLVIVLFIILYLIILLITGFLASTQLFGSIVIILNAISLVFITIVCVGTIIITYLQWKNLYYEIQPGVVSKRWGVLDKQVKTLKFDNTSIITLSQGILGKYFDYGNIYIKSATEDDLSLFKIPKPGQKLTILQDFIRQLEGNPIIRN